MLPVISPESPLDWADERRDFARQQDSVRHDS